MRSELCRGEFFLRITILAIESQTREELVDVHVQSFAIKLMRWAFDMTISIWLLATVAENKACTLSFINAFYTRVKHCLIAIIAPWISSFNIDLIALMTLGFKVDVNNHFEAAHTREHIHELLVLLELARPIGVVPVA